MDRTIGMVDIIVGIAAISIPTLSSLKVVPSSLFLFAAALRVFPVRAVVV
jgi:hypothetical protein